MHQIELVNWLYENGGPVIRFRTATELMPPSRQVDFGQLRKDLLQSKIIKTYYDRISPSFLLNDIHGGKENSFENIIGKLTDLGLRQGMPEFDQFTLPYRTWLSENAERPLEHIFDIFSRTLIAAFLARAGYIRESVIQSILRERLNTVYNFVRSGNFNIYVSPDGFKKMPANFQGRPLINPELTRNGNISLPLIYDILGWESYLSECGTKDDQAKADTIINYIFSKEYQKLPWGYGVMLDDITHRYYAMGWSVHMPGIAGSPERNPGNSSIVQMVNLLINYEVAR
jgi:hypothetical protein